MEKQFNRVRSASDVIVSVSMLASGAILMFFPSNIGVNIGGFFLLLSGSLFICMYKNGYKESESKVMYHKKELYFRRDTLKSLREAVLTDPGSIELSNIGKGWTLKLNLYYNKKNGKAYLQLFEYLPYNYEPVTDMLEYDIAEIKGLIK